MYSLPQLSAEKHLTPYTIKNLKEPCVRDKVRKCPYKQCEEDCSFDARMKNLSAEENTSTNRIIRCYEGHGGAQPKLLYRFDWQLPNTILKYEDFQELNGKDILAIIIEDHGKGVVNCECIKKLIESIGQDEARKISWYIRTKVDKPSWIKTWDEYKITAKLVVSDTQLANYRKGIRRATYGKELGRFSLELLGEITDDILYEHSSAKKKTIFKSQKAAILLDNNTAIAKADNTCFNLFQPYGKKQLLNIGRTAMFFSALIAQDIKPVVGEDFGRQCDKALQCSYEWTKETTEAWNAEEPHFFGNYDKALRWLDRESRLYEYSEANYRELWNRWNASSTRYGIIHFADFRKTEFRTPDDVNKLCETLIRDGFNLDKDKDPIQSLNKLLEDQTVHTKQECYPDSTINNVLQSLRNNLKKFPINSSFDDLGIYEQHLIKWLNRLIIEHRYQSKILSLSTMNQNSSYGEGKERLKTMYAWAGQNATQLMIS